MGLKKARKYFSPERTRPDGRKREKREGKNLQENQTQENHQRAGAEGKTSAQVSENLVEGREMRQGRSQGSQKTVSQYSPGMKGKMMGNPQGPGSSYRNAARRIDRPEVKRIGHDQRPAHAQAVKAADETDEKGRNDFDHNLIGRR